MAWGPGMPYCRAGWQREARDRADGAALSLKTVWREFFPIRGPEACNPLREAFT